MELVGTRGGKYEYVWWQLIAQIQGSRGPYSQLGKRGETFKLYNIALELFPHGPPSPGKPWVASCLETAKFAKLIEGLFQKNGYLGSPLLFPECAKSQFVITLYLVDLARRFKRSFLEVAKLGCFCILNL